VQRCLLLQVICSLLNDGLIQGVSISAYKASAVQQVIATSPGITQAGARYLKENSKMAEICEFLGKAFEVVLATFVAATQVL
jgi:hypothetical protein